MDYYREDQIPATTTRGAIHISQLPPVPSSITIGTDWRVVLWNPTNNTTYLVPLTDEPGGAAGAPGGTAARVVTYGQVAEEIQQTALQPGRWSFVTERPNASIGIWVFEAARGAVANFGIEVDTDNDADFPASKLVAYDFDNDEVGSFGGGRFTPISENQVGQHPAFDSQDELNLYLLGGVVPSPVAPNPPTNGAVNDTDNYFSFTPATVN